MHGGFIGFWFVSMLFVVHCSVWYCLDLARLCFALTLSAFLKWMERSDTCPVCDEEISAMVLIKIKETTEVFFGKKIQNVVITVPVLDEKYQDLVGSFAKKVMVKVMWVPWMPRRVFVNYSFGLVEMHQMVQWPQANSDSKDAED